MARDLASPAQKLSSAPAVPSGSKAVAEIESEKGRAVAVSTDVTKRQDLERLASTAVRHSVASMCSSKMPESCSSPLSTSLRSTNGTALSMSTSRASLRYCRCAVSHE